MRALALATIALTTAWGAPALAQIDPQRPQVMVQGSGTVESPPAQATIGYSVTGEGLTAEASTAAFIARRKAIEDELARVGVALEAVHGSNMSVDPARSKDCSVREYPVQPRLSTGACAIVGYVTTAAFTVVVAPPEHAGTVVAAIARKDGAGARVKDFAVADPADAAKRATVKAVANARALAETIASATGAHLGALLDVHDSDLGGGYYADQARLRAPPPVQVHESPVAVVNLEPAPIKTTVRITVTYAIAP